MIFDLQIVLVILFTSIEATYETRYCLGKALYTQLTRNAIKEININIEDNKLVFKMIAIDNIEKNYHYIKEKTGIKKMLYVCKDWYCYSKMNSHKTISVTKEQYLLFKQSVTNLTSKIDTGKLISITRLMCKLQNITNSYLQKTMAAISISISSLLRYNSTLRIHLMVMLIQIVTMMKQNIAFSRQIINKVYLQSIKMLFAFVLMSKQNIRSVALSVYSFFSTKSLHLQWLVISNLEMIYSHRNFKSKVLMVVRFVCTSVRFKLRYK